MTTNPDPKLAGTWSRELERRMDALGGGRPTSQQAYDVLQSMGLLWPYPAPEGYIKRHLRWGFEWLTPDESYSLFDSSTPPRQSPAVASGRELQIRRKQEAKAKKAEAVRLWRERQKPNQ